MRADGNARRQPYPPRLIFIDGLRGIAAFVVAVGHSIGMVPPDHTTTPIWSASPDQLLVWPWLFGRPMVWLFIMLSGFALYWSEESRRDAGRGATALTSYFKRRLWRILPVYYLALALGLLVVIGAGDVLLEPSESLTTFAPITPDGLLAHLVLIHNINPAWIYQVSPPLWSIAVEVQLYLLFPLIFVLRSKISVYGAVLALVVAVWLGNQVLNFQFFSLIELFGLGAILAHVGRRWVAPRSALFTVAAIFLLVGLCRPTIPPKAEELLWALGFAALILALIRTRHSNWNVPTWRPIVWLGARSYSLYALHFPVLLLGWAFIGRLGLPNGLEVPIMAAGGMAAAIGVAHLSYIWIEQPSILRSRRA
ncbi:acyltransferase [Curtobacterium sp. MCBA15_012]|uniref:acyltransferase family protein n=1 Tax=Curtobacterium sp. MCBA15_012 TaxID=1898738 RepID=UPI0009F2EAAB|nr:acyltransferase [Curtobacterium sp. MCBA15_012]WIB00729.1 acyltransferase [Curtobacterium sp. MCBA15_012]